MSRVLFLTHRMKRGYGVDLEVHEISSRLANRGHIVAVLCLEADGSLRGPYEVRELAFAAVDEVLEFAGPFRPSVVTAFTSPFIEMLPSLSATYDCWAWENGDPTPELFPDDGEKRARVKRHKIDNCYPALRGVVTISEFLRRDIEWPSAHVIYLGCDHAPDLGEKNLPHRPPASDNPMRIGTLMRLGPREAHYKGNDEFLSLAKRVAEAGMAAQFSLMGRGTKKDARKFRAAGFEVSLNAADEEKWDYLRGLDIFVSCSLWEGFNLPLVEAQALGTAAIAFDSGAHPEVTPLVFSDTEAMLSFLLRARDPEVLIEHSRAAYRHARNSFRWSETTRHFHDLALTEGAGRKTAGRRDDPTSTPFALDRNAVPTGLRASLVATLRSARNYGWRATARKIKRRLGSRPESHRREL